MDFPEDDYRLEEIDPWKTNDNVKHVTCALKEGLEISKLSTTGADFELVQEANSFTQKEDEEDQRLQYQRKVVEHLNPECADFCEEEDEANEDTDGLSPFAKMAINMADLTGDGGVMKKVLTDGTGPLVPDGAVVRVHYNGYLEYCDEPYDSSRLRNKEQKFRLGKGEVLLGWDVGVTSMKKKELARFLVKPEYAFGEFGCPPRIPPDATIMFEIEVVSYIDVKAADNFGHYTEEEKAAVGLDELLSVTNAYREEGNDAFNYGNYGRASSKYLKAVRLLEKRRLKSDAEESKWKTTLLKLYLNLSLCNIRLRKPKLAITNSRNALELDEKNVKAIFRLGQAHMQLSEFDQCRHYLVRAGRLSPGNVEIRRELEKLNRVVGKFKSAEKNIYTKMFPSLNNTDATVSEEGGEEEEDMTLTESQLDDYRALYHEKFSEIRKNPNLFELIVPLPLPRRELACAQEIAAQLNLHTEMLPGNGLRVYRDSIPEMEAFLEDH